MAEAYNSLLNLVVYSLRINITDHYIPLVYRMLSIVGLTTHVANMYIYDY